MKNVNMKKLSAIILAGGIALTTMPKCHATEVEREAHYPGVVENAIDACKKNINLDLNYDEYCLLCYNACEYLNKLGINVTIDELFAPIYLFNIASVNNELQEQLIKEGFISDNPANVMNDVYNFLG